MEEELRNLIVERVVQMKKVKRQEAYVSNQLKAIDKDFKEYMPNATITQERQLAQLKDEYKAKADKEIEESKSKQKGIEDNIQAVMDTYQKNVIDPLKKEVEETEKRLETTAEQLELLTIRNFHTNGYDISNVTIESSEEYKAHESAKAAHDKAIKELAEHNEKFENISAKLKKINEMIMNAKNVEDISMEDIDKVFAIDKEKEENIDAGSVVGEKAPAEAGNPVKPQAPQKPQTPQTNGQEPQTDGKAKTPAEAGNPVKPQAPQTNGKAKAPAEAGNPVKPQAPQTNGKAKTPAEAGNPVKPQAPQTDGKAKTPAEAGNPVKPQAPQTNGQAEAPKGEKEENGFQIIDPAALAPREAPKTPKTPQTNGQAPQTNGQAPQTNGQAKAPAGTGNPVKPPKLTEIPLGIGEPAKAPAQPANGKAKTVTGTIDPAQVPVFVGAWVDVANGAVQLKDKDGKYSWWARSGVFKGHGGVFKRMVELCLTRILYNRNATIKWCKKNAPFYDEKLDPYVVRKICEDTKSILKANVNGKVDEEKIKEAMMDNISKYCQEVDNGFVNYVCNKCKKPSKYTMKQEKQYIQNALNNCPTCVESEVKNAVPLAPWYERLINSVKNRVSTIKLGFSTKKLLAKGSEKPNKEPNKEPNKKPNNEPNKEPNKKPNNEPNNEKDDSYVDVPPIVFFEAPTGNETGKKDDKGSVGTPSAKPINEHNGNAKKPENAKGDKGIETDEAKSGHDDGPEL